MVKKMRLTEEGEQLTEEEKNQIMAGVEELRDIFSSMKMLQDLEGDLEKIDVEHRMTLNKLEESHKKTVKGIYEERDAILRKIPKFWMKSFLGHTELVKKLTDMDREILKYLDSFRVDSLNDNAYVITLGFHQNPFFENTELVIPYLETSVAASKINWKSTGTQGSVRLFNDSLWADSEEYTDDLANFHEKVLDLIVIELWESPLEYYRP